MRSILFFLLSVYYAQVTFSNAGVLAEKSGEIGLVVKSTSISKATRSVIEIPLQDKCTGDKNCMELGKQAPYNLYATGVTALYDLVTCTDAVGSKIEQYTLVRKPNIAKPDSKEIEVETDNAIKGFTIFLDIKPRQCKIAKQGLVDITLPLKTTCTTQDNCMSLANSAPYTIYATGVGAQQTSMLCTQAGTGNTANVKLIHSSSPASPGELEIEVDSSGAINGKSIFLTFVPNKCTIAGGDGGAPGNGVIPYNRFGLGLLVICAIVGNVL